VNSLKLTQSVTVGILLLFTNPLSAAAKFNAEDVLFIEDLYVEHVGYKPNAQGLAKYLPLLDEDGGRERVTKLVSESTEAKQFYIKNLYLTLVGYVPQYFDFLDYLPLMKNKEDWETVRKVIAESPEAKEYTIRQLYLQYVGYEPDARGIAHYLPLFKSESDRANIEKLISQSPEAIEKKRKDEQAASELMNHFVESYQFDSDQNELRNEISQIDPNHRRLMALSYYSHFYKNLHYYPENVREGQFYRYLKVLDLMFPDAQIFNYFFDFGKQIANAPNLEGMKILIEYFNTKKKGTNQYENTLNDIVALPLQQLTSRLNELKNSDFLGEKRFLVLNQGTVGGHYVPVFLKRSPSETQIIVTDSGPWSLIDKKTGEQVLNKYVLRIQDAINRSELKNTQLYTFAYGRQADGVSCSITSLRDILESNKFSLFQYIQTLEPSQIDQWGNTDLHIIHSYPPEFMKVAQRLSYIDPFESKHPEWKNKKISMKPHLRNGNKEIEYRTLRQVMDTHTVDVLTDRGFEKRNFYLRRRAFKYFGVILNNILQSDEIKRT
jgi:hypothetical protein